MRYILCILAGMPLFHIIGQNFMAGFIDYSILDFLSLLLCSLHYCSGPNSVKRGNQPTCHLMFEKKGGRCAMHCSKLALTQLKGHVCPRRTDDGFTLTLFLSCFTRWQVLLTTLFWTTFLYYFGPFMVVPDPIQ